ncbi:MAG: LytR/AlgR family response regulator transcription factor [Aestuariibacter sp.]
MSNFLVLKDSSRIRILRHEEIDIINAAGNYIEISKPCGTKLLHRASLKNIQAKLPRERFCRIHKSTIVRLDLIEELRPIHAGDYEVKLKNGNKLVLTRRFKNEFPFFNE